MIDVCMIDFDAKRVCTKDNNINLAYDFNDVVLMPGLQIFNQFIYLNDIVLLEDGECIYGVYEISKKKIVNNFEDILAIENLDCFVEVIGNIYENSDLLEERYNENILYMEENR